MNLEEAIQTAISFENRIRDLYGDSVNRILDPAGRKFLAALRDDEQHHMEYLESRLDLLRKTGRLHHEELMTRIRFDQRIPDETAKLEKRMPKKDLGDEKQILSRALQVEVETSNFYKDMVQTFPKSGREMFARFVEIEDAHTHAVQMELDFLEKNGYWFDFKEFDME
ncbi:MAG: rubrerythrin [Thermodesulfobacteriota bacterium]